MKADPVEVALAVPLRGGKILVARRPAGSHLAGLWEFPGGKLAPGEEALVAVRRELREETGLSGGVVEQLAVLVHDYVDRVVRLHVFLVREPEGAVKIEGKRRWAWISRGDLGALEMPAANAAIVRELARRLP